LSCREEGRTGDPPALYAERRAALVERLAVRGIPIPPGDGLCIWVPVESEQYALVTLPARGIAVHPGTKLSVRPIRHIRVAASILFDRYDFVADALGRAAVRGVAEHGSGSARAGHRIDFYSPVTIRSTSKAAPR
jgi:hypothetical protein